MKDAIKLFLLASLLFCACSPVGEIHVDSRDITVDSSAHELSFRVSGDRAVRVCIVLRINDEVVGNNNTMMSILDESYDYTVQWCRVKYDETDNRLLTVYLEENNTGQDRSALVGVDNNWGAFDGVTITQKSAIPE